MGKDNGVITANEAMRMLQEKSEIGRNIIVMGSVTIFDVKRLTLKATFSGDTYLNGNYDSAWVDGNFDSDFYFNGNCKSATLSGNFKGAVHLNGTLDNLSLNGNFFEKIYTNQRDIAEVAHFAGILVIISSKNYRGEK
ncbi:hypothetical protein KAU19_04360 [Candidatus Parcubacteria bacterium]|nr:hypothetical protein [Candidatus Parcubacteria bacterium]